MAENLNWQGKDNNEEEYFIKIKDWDTLWSILLINPDIHFVDDNPKLIRSVLTKAAAKEVSQVAGAEIIERKAICN